MAMGDVDGDGDLDLVFASSPRDLLYLNDGKGAFMDVTAASMPLGSDARFLFLQDLDGDGDLDLLALSDGGPGRSLYLYLNDGSGAFTDGTASRLPSPSLFGLAVGDVDGDGDLDMAHGGVFWPSKIVTNLQVQIDTPLFPFPSREFVLDFYAKPGYGTSFHLAVPAMSPGRYPSPLE